MIAALLGSLAEPFAEPIGRRALAEVVLLGLAGGALGCWLVAYNLSYSAESLAHALLPGLVVASLAGLPLLLGAAAGLLAAALTVALAGRAPAVGRDAAVAVVVSAMLGLGALLALAPATPAGLQALLFGDVLAVTDGDLALAGALVGAVLAALWLLHGRLLVVGFDRLNAGALGVRPARVDAALLVLLAVALLVAVQGLGNLLVVAVLLAPAAAARLVARRMAPMLVASSAIAVAAGTAGLEISFHARTAAGASIAGALVAAYALAALFARARS
jgi:ABC-type Mn2+/Zn2+ transport system permease subunit